MAQDFTRPHLDAALQAAARGWFVFPLRPGSKRPALHGEASCPGTGPCAAGHAKWEQRATTDLVRIRAAWSATPYNVGIATGPSGLVVVDLDVPKGDNAITDSRPCDGKDAPCGAATFKALCERAGRSVPATFRVRTASGGEHLYFAAPHGARLGNTARTLGPGVDTRAWGGYVVAPGSETLCGPYSVVDDQSVANLPEWLQTALTAPQKPAPAPILPVPARNACGYAVAALRNEERAVAAAPEGRRNWTLTRAARALGRFIASGDLTRAEVEQALKQAAEAAGLLPREIGPCITSALNWSIARNPGRVA